MAPEAWRRGSRCQGSQTWRRVVSVPTGPWRPGAGPRRTSHSTTGWGLLLLIYPGILTGGSTGCNTQCACRCFFSPSDGSQLFGVPPQSLGLPGLHVAGPTFGGWGHTENPTLETGHLCPYPFPPNFRASCREVPGMTESFTHSSSTY